MIQRKNINQSSSRNLFSITHPNRHYGCRVNDKIIWNGIQSLILQNELLQIVIHVEKGSEITQFLYKPRDIDFIWHNPRELHNPSSLSTAAGSDTSPFLDHWSGGWFETVPNGGPSCDYKGAHLGFFAETVNIPWHYQILQDDPDCVKVGLWVKTYRTPFVLRKTLTIRSNIPALFIEEQLTNESNEDLDYLWMHHPVLGSPFLDDSCRINCPECKTIVWEDEDGPDYRMKLNQEGQWPFVEGLDGNKIDLRQVLSAQSRTMDNTYLTDFKEPWVGVTNSNLGLGFGFAFDPIMWKYMLLWQGYGGGIGYPWFHSTYHLGIEPWSGFPCAGLDYAIKNKTANKLKAGKSVKTWLTAAAYHGNDDIKNISKDGKVTFA